MQGSKGKGERSSAEEGAKLITGLRGVIPTYAFQAHINPITGSGSTGSHLILAL
jgi:hypothetical protein